MPYYVYILANSSNTVIYVGVTNNLAGRVWEHKKHLDPKSFTARYNVDKLVYFESGNSIEGAIYREKQLKGWKRVKKDALVNEMNPEWKDLYDTLF